MLCTIKNDSRNFSGLKLATDWVNWIHIYCYEGFPFLMSNQDILIDQSL